MKLKKITSLTLTWSFLLLVLSSLVLFVMPQGKVAYWANWSWVGLDKNAWGALHTNIGYLFLISCVLHIYFNWNSIVAYIKNKGRDVSVLNPNNVISLVLVLVVAVFSIFALPPLSLIQGLSDHFKGNAVVKYGEPPYGHAELSTIEGFCRRSGLEMSDAVSLLSASGIAAKPEQTLLELSESTGLTPQALAGIMSQGVELKKQGSGGSCFGGDDGITATETKTSHQKHTENEGAQGKGYGMKTLQEVCEELNYEYSTVEKLLSQAGFEPAPTKKIKDIAAGRGERASAIMAILLPGGH